MSMFELFWPAWLAAFSPRWCAAHWGSLLVWRRLAYFGDSLSHAALLGVGLSLLLSIPGLDRHRHRLPGNGRAAQPAHETTRTRLGHLVDHSGHERAEPWPCRYQLY